MQENSQGENDMTTQEMTLHKTLDRSRFGWYVLYATIAFWVLALILQFVLPISSQPLHSFLDVAEGFVDGFGFLCFTLVGALLLSRGNNLGRAYLVPGFIYNLGFLLMHYSLYGLYINPLPGYIPVALSGNISFLITIFTALVVIPLLYPAGQPSSKLDNFLCKFAVGAITIGALGILVTPGPVNEPEFMAPNPFGMESAKSILEPVMGVTLLTLLALVLIAAGAMIARIRKADPVLKKQLIYFIAGEAALGFVFLSDSFIQPIMPIWGPIAPLIAIPAIPLATYLALIRNQSE